MVKRRNLNQPPAKSMADIVRALNDKAMQGKTVAAGVKHLGATGDVVFDEVGADGSVVTHSVREDRAQIELAAKEIEAAAGRLDTLENVTLPGAVERLEAADAAAQSTLSDLDSRLAAATAAVDQVTLDARDAHNAAVAAQAAADDALAKYGPLDQRTLDAQAAADTAAARANDAYALAESKPDMGAVQAEITTAANGKNKITVSTSAPTSSTPGAVPGDTWWRVDDANSLFGQWTWTGSAWAPAMIRDELLGSVSAHKLVVTGDAKMAQAVIDKLWVDGLAAKAITTARLTVSNGNLIPDGTEMLEDSRWSPLVYDTVDKPAELPSSRRSAVGQKSVAMDPAKANAFPVTPGQEYLVEMWIKADKPGSRFYLEIRDFATGGHGGTGTLTSPVAKSTSAYVLFNSETVPTAWTKYVGTWKPNAGVSKAYLGTAYFNHAAGTELGAQVWVAGLTLRAKTGAVLIEDGAITTPKLTVTEELAGKIADFMSLAARQVVVTSTLADADTAGKLGGVFINEQGIVTSGPTGSVVLNSTGLTQYATNADGVAEPVVQLGTGGDTTENVFTAGNTVLSRASVSSPQGNFDTLTVAGDDITDLLTRGPRGVVAHYVLNTTSAWHAGNTEVSRVKITADLEPGRMYRAYTNAHFIESPNATINIVETIRWAYGENVTDSGAAMAQGRFTIASGDAKTVPGLEGILDTGSWTTAQTVSVALRYSGGGADSRYVAAPSYPCRLVLEDIGPAKPASGMSYQNLGTALQVQTPPPATPQETVKTVTWNAGTYGGDVSSGEVIQGQYGSYGNRSGGWAFHSGMLSALQSAKSIQKFEVYLYASHWYYGAGGTASIRPNNGSYKATFGTTQVESPRWPRNAGRWVTVPSTWHQYFMNGTYKGISVQTANTALTHYGRFTATATKFRVTYTV